MLEGSDPAHALFDPDRPADHDGVPRPLRSVVLYYLRLADQVPENHLLRLIDKHISFEFVPRLHS
jgi:hypothetical protein